MGRLSWAATHARRSDDPAEPSLSDAASFARSVEAHLPKMLRIAARMAPRTTADDVVQEALLRAWRYRSRYDARLGPASNWLLKIVMNEARRQAAKRSLPIDILVEASHSSLDDRLDIEAAVRRLTERQRLAVDCYYYADLSISETTTLMECSDGTVKSTLADARDRLRSLLQEPQGA